jgi:hypothetical protein
MHTIDLAYAGHGIHEELVAYVADQEGYCEDEDLHVAIRDGVHWETERLRRSATIGLGRALLSRLTDCIGWKMLSVNTHRPLFWFLGSAEVTSMADLRGRRLAVHAAHIWRSMGRLIDLVGGYWGDTEFGCDRVDRLPGYVEVHLAVGSEVRADVAFVVPLRFITGEPVEERGDVVDCQAGLFGEAPQRSLVGPHQRLQCGAIQRDVGGIDGNAHGGDLEVIADPGQKVKPFFLGDLFG